MLTVDLVRARKKDGKLRPSYLKGPAAERLLPVARFTIDVLRRMVGETRDEVESVLGTAEVQARDRVAALGLRKVIEDRCAFEVREGADPEALRREVFWTAAKAHKALDLRQDFDRDAVLGEVATRLATSTEALEAGLYADLWGSELLTSGPDLGAETAIERYNLGLAQAVLLRALRVRVRVESASAASYRRLFRAARFHQLLYVVRKEAGAYVIELDGPFSLFDSVQRYGLRLAMFLPSVLAFASFHVEADVLWGKERAPATFEITPDDELVPGAAEPLADESELELFAAAFGRLESPWSVRRSDRIFALPGEVVCVPDLVFENGDTGEVVYLETFGFWSRSAVWQRVELLQKASLGARIILAVGKQLRVSEEVLGDDDAGELYVYARSMSPRAVLERLNSRTLRS